MLLVAATLSGFAWWWRWTQADDATRFWGAAHIDSLLSPERVEAFRLVPTPQKNEPTSREAAAEDGEVLAVAKRSYLLQQKQDITTARGLLNARHSLSQDASFDWSRLRTQAADPAAGSYVAGIRLHRAGRTTTLLFDFEQRLLAVAEDEVAIFLAVPTNRGWQTYFERTIGLKLP
jgi:hypothetical protein